MQKIDVDINKRGKMSKFIKLFWQNSKHYFSPWGAWEEVDSFSKYTPDWLLTSFLIIASILLTPIAMIISIGLFLYRTPKRIKLIIKELKQPTPLNVLQRGGD